MADPASYRRVILGMGPGSVDRLALRAASEFASLLELQMLGIFVEDATMLRLADLPFVRELRLPGRGWETLDPARLLDELRLAADQARRLFEQEVASRGVVSHFEVHRGDPSTLLSGLAQATDIVVAAEPAGTTDWSARPHTPAWRAVLASPAAVLWLPPSQGIGSGPVAVVAAGETEPVCLLASRIAAAAGEERVIVTPAGARSVRGIAVALGQALGRQRERLVILQRTVEDGLDDLPLRLARERGTPVLVVEAAAHAG
jgi:hypothetical protein